MPTVIQNDNDILITHIFDAPVSLVFKAWTNPEQLVQWYAPNGCSINFIEIDISEGGNYYSCITTSTGYKCWCKGTYLEIVSNSKIVQTMNMADEHGNLVEPAVIGMDPEWPKETLLTITFEEQDNKTKLTLHQTASEVVAKRTGAYQSWGQMLDNLAVLTAQR
ncbi:MAG: SRPBCC domain-containing protein [Mucilaginibacter sp.]|uniref:SRPBCC family protein n=1 Tax=Mucilaginibacter sp. TaxID=1882438 RepID=UPI0032652D30